MIAGFPEFIKPRPDAEANDLNALDFWAPRYRPELDVAANFEMGQQYFEQAMEFAWRVGNGTPAALIEILKDMMRYHAGPVEMGFLAAFARRATVGVIPPMSDDLIKWAVFYSPDIDEAEMRYGAQEASDVLDIARSIKNPALVSCYLVGLHGGTFGYGMKGFAWAICGAALTGCHN